MKKKFLAAPPPFFHSSSRLLGVLVSEMEITRKRRGAEARDSPADQRGDGDDPRRSKLQVAEPFVREMLLGKTEGKNSGLHSSRLLTPISEPIPCRLSHQVLNEGEDVRVSFLYNDPSASLMRCKCLNQKVVCRDPSLFKFTHNGKIYKVSHSSFPIPETSS